MKTVYGVEWCFAPNRVATQQFYCWSGSATSTIDGKRSLPAYGPSPKVFRASDENEERDKYEDEEVVQICNLNESVLRLEEMAQKRRITFQLNKDGLNGLRALYHEFLDLNSRSRSTATQRSRMTPCKVAASRGFCGLMSEDVDSLDEQTLTQLVREFDLENVEELPVLQMEALSNYI